MYGFCNATLLGETVEEVEKKIEPYRKYPFFSNGPIRSTENAPRFKRQGKFMVIVNFFNND